MSSVVANKSGHFHNKQSGQFASTPRASATRRTKRTPRATTRKAVSEKAVTVGSKAQVYHGTAKHTAGGLVQADLVMNKRGKIVSRKQQAAGRKSLKHLTSAGYIAKKGEFKLMKKH